jgi:hypothetical protein
MAGKFQDASGYSSRPTQSLVIFTVAAHLVFGAVMGLAALGLSRLLTPSAYG